MKQKKTTSVASQPDYTKIKSLDDIKNFKFAETERNPYEK